MVSTIANGTLNVDQVLKEVYEAECNAKKEAQGKELVLFVGNTRAGKSTLINYLAGRQMRLQHLDNPRNGSSRRQSDARF